MMGHVSGGCSTGKVHVSRVGIRLDSTALPVLMKMQNVTPSDARVWDHLSVFTIKWSDGLTRWAHSLDSHKSG